MEETYATSKDYLLAKFSELTEGYAQMGDAVNGMLESTGGKLYDALAVVNDALDELAPKLESLDAELDLVRASER